MRGSNLDHLQIMERSQDRKSQFKTAWPTASVNQSGPIGIYLVNDSVPSSADTVTMTAGKRVGGMRDRQMVQH